MLPTLLAHRHDVRFKRWDPDELDGGALRAEAQRPPGDAGAHEPGAARVGLQRAIAPWYGRVEAISVLTARDATDYAAALAG